MPDIALFLTLGVWVSSEGLGFASLAVLYNGSGRVIEDGERGGNSKFRRYPRSIINPTLYSNHV